MKWAPVFWLLYKRRVSLEGQYCAHLVPAGHVCFDEGPRGDISEAESHWTVGFLVNVLLQHWSSAS